MSDDTSSHVRVSHLYDELLYSFSAIEIKCWLHYVREKIRAHELRAHEREPLALYSNTVLWWSKELSKFDVDALCSFWVIAI